MRLFVPQPQYDRTALLSDRTNQPCVSLSELDSRCRPAAELHHPFGQLRDVGLQGDHVNPLQSNGRAFTAVADRNPAIESIALKPVSALTGKPIRTGVIGHHTGG